MPEAFFLIENDGSLGAGESHGSLLLRDMLCAHYISHTAWRNAEGFIGMRDGPSLGCSASCVHPQCCSFPISLMSGRWQKGFRTEISRGSREENMLLTGLQGRMQAHPLTVADTDVL